MTEGDMNSFSDPALIGLMSTVAISVGVSLIVAGALAVWSGRLLDLAPEHILWAFLVGFAFLCSLSTVPISEPGTWSDTLFVAMIPVWAILIYFLPSVAAIYGGQPNLNGIFFMNLLFGWTIAGWIVALSWTLRRREKVKRANLRRIALRTVANEKAGRPTGVRLFGALSILTLPRRVP
jgi:hypothetical protein